VRELDATNDKAHFEPPDDGGRWPVYKGASFNLWEPDTGVRYGWADPKRITGVLQEKRLRASTRSNSAFAAMPPTWVVDPDTLPCLRPRIAFRDVARATDTRTVIACLIPPRVVATNQAPYLLWIDGDERDQAYLLGVLCSIPLDWYARRMVETHVNFHVLNSFPVPRPGRDDPRRRRVEQIAGRLAAVDDRYTAWAHAVGVPVGSVSSDDERDDLIAELDAVVARLYGLDEDDVVHIFETFHTGWDYGARLERVRKHFRAIEAKVGALSSDGRDPT
jgi:hypothetical protein